MKMNSTLVKLGYAALFLIFRMAATAAAQDSSQHYLSDSAMLKIAGDKYATGELPLGDGKYVLDAPRMGYIYLCRKFGEEGPAGAERNGPWIHGGTWNLHEKISVDGQVRWPNAYLSIRRQGDQRIFDGNGLPTEQTTGIFPIQPNDPAYAFDRNPNSIVAQSIKEALPANPAYSDPPYCMGMEAGYMLNGVPLFNGFDAGMRDAAAHEIQDSCQGHPQRTGTYHYHSLSSCLQNAAVKNVIGYALDGFPITGPTVTQGKYLTTANLDECHGITSEIIEDGHKKISYHYVMTEDFPYSVSCFRARPVRIGPLQRIHGTNNAEAGGELTLPAGPVGNDGPRRPPIEALNACAGKRDSDACDFVSPRGDSISGTCHAPPHRPLACMPAHPPE